MISSCCLPGALSEWWLLNPERCCTNCSQAYSGFALRQLWACGQCAGTSGGSGFLRDQGVASDCCLCSTARCLSPSLLLCRAEHPHLHHLDSATQPEFLSCLHKGLPVIKYPCKLSSTATNVEGMMHLMLFLERVCAYWLGDTEK